MAASVRNAFAVFGGAAAVVAAVSSVTRAVLEQEKAAAKLDATLRSTGGTVGLTRDELMGLADQVARQSLFDDDAIVDGIAVLTTFRNISGQTFREATQLAADMATVMNGDLQGSLVQVGKALNDPVKGLTALSRVGVQFTNEQKAMIEGLVRVNDLAGAQRVILDELATQFGGAGAASTKGLAGAIHQARMAWDNFLASLGNSETILGKATQAVLRLAAATLNGISGGPQLSRQQRLEGEVKDLETLNERNRETGRRNPADFARYGMAEAIARREQLIAAKKKEIAVEELKAKGAQMYAEWAAREHQKELARAAEIEAAREREKNRQAEALRSAKEYAKFLEEIDDAIIARRAKDSADAARFKALADTIPGLRPQDARLANRPLEIPGGRVSADDAVARSLADREAERSRELSLLAREQERLQRAAQQAAEFERIWKRAGLGAAESIGQAFADLLTFQENALKNFLSNVEAVLNDLTRSLISQLINLGIQSAFGTSLTGPSGGFGGGAGAADGAFGGAFGLESGGGGMVVVQAPISLNVQSVDPVTARDLVLEQMPTIAEQLARTAERSASFRQRLRGVR